jgi:hypothetical protein
MERSLMEIAAEVVAAIEEHGWIENGVPNLQNQSALNDFALVAILSGMYPDPNTAEAVMGN